MRAPPTQLRLFRRVWLYSCAAMTAPFRLRTSFDRPVLERQIHLHALLPGVLGLERT
jgi:hypothetical protein